MPQVPPLCTTGSAVPGSIAFLLCPYSKSIYLPAYRLQRCQHRTECETHSGPSVKGEAETSDPSPGLSHEEVVRLRIRTRSETAIRVFARARSNFVISLTAVEWL